MLKALRGRARIMEPYHHGDVFVSRWGFDINSSEDPVSEAKVLEVVDFKNETATLINFQTMNCNQ